MSFSVVVCTRNRPEALARCLESLQALDYPAFETIVVDNAPSDRAAEEVARRFQARYLVEPDIGLSRARNRGWKAALGDFVAFIDDDACPHPSWVRDLAREFADERVGVVTGTTLPFAAAATLAATHRPGRERLVVSRGPGAFIATNFGTLGDANMAIRRSCGERWAGFHERLGRGCALDSLEEHYAYFQLVELGYVAVRSPAAIVYHDDRSGAEGVSRLKKDHAAAGAYLLFLFREHPEHRAELVRFVLRGLWRRLAGRSQPSPLPLTQAARSWISGVAVYRRFRKRQ